METLIEFIKKHNLKIEQVINFELPLLVGIEEYNYFIERLKHETTRL
jgi:uncharacterized short protein YbdD (DUF466 family)